VLVLDPSYEELIITYILNLALGSNVLILNGQGISKLFEPKRDANGGSLCINLTRERTSIRPVSSWATLELSAGLSHLIPHPAAPILASLVHVENSYASIIFNFSGTAPTSDFPDLAVIAKGPGATYFQMKDLRIHLNPSPRIPI
jgi:hypothetical protein